MFLCSQAPAATEIAKKCATEGGASILKPTGRYLPTLAKHFVTVFSYKGVARKPRIVRRDKGLPREEVEARRKARSAPIMMNETVRHRTDAVQRALQLKDSARKRLADAAQVVPRSAADTAPFHTASMKAQFVKHTARAAADTGRQLALPQPTIKTHSEKKGGRWASGPRELVVGPRAGALLLPQDADDDLEGLSFFYGARPKIITIIHNY